MRRFLRRRQQGGIYFFTLTTHERQFLLASEENVGQLRAALEWVKHRHPFQMDAIVILPDHLHCIWRLPPGDDDFRQRWMQIKRRFSLTTGELGSPYQSFRDRQDRGIWQRRCREHLIRDEKDWRMHMDYIHYNPVKHGYVDSVRDWPYSSFMSCVERGWYEPGWGKNDIHPDVLSMALE